MLGGDLTAMATLRFATIPLMPSIPAIRKE
jgi:hypothetical protein